MEDIERALHMLGKELTWFDERIMTVFNGVCPI